MQSAMSALRFRLAALALAGLLVSACGDILDEVDKANELASKPSGNRPVAPVPGAKPGAAPPSQAGPPAKAEGEGPGLLDRVQGLLGLGEPREGSRLPPDPNDPMVLCRLDGSTGFMLKSGCINRRGTVLASKGVPR